MQLLCWGGAGGKQQLLASARQAGGGWVSGRASARWAAGGWAGGLLPGGRAEGGRIGGRMAGRAGGLAGRAGWAGGLLSGGPVLRVTCMREYSCRTLEQFSRGIWGRHYRGGGVGRCEGSDTGVRGGCEGQ